MWAFQFHFICAIYSVPYTQPASAPQSISFQSGDGILTYFFWELPPCYSLSHWRRESLVFTNICLFIEIHSQRHARVWSGSSTQQYPHQPLDSPITPLKSQERFWNTSHPLVKFQEYHIKCDVPLSRSRATIAQPYRSTPPTTKTVNHGTNTIEVETRLTFVTYQPEARYLKAVSIRQARTITL